MIIDLHQFMEKERPYWTELESFLDRMDRDMAYRPDLAELRRFHYLYSRCCSDLSRLASFVTETQIQHYLESLVARAYSEIHETRKHQMRFSLKEWLVATLPQTFRRHIRYFILAALVMLFGSVLGSAFLSMIPTAKEVVMPFPHLLVKPSERVAYEEKSKTDRMEGAKAGFSAQLMTHNTRVAITTFALGATYGAGTFVLLLYNGVILGAVCWDYIWDGQLRFLVGWLLPHGSVEIPAILIAGQAGFVLAGAIIGWGDRTPIRRRLRSIGADVITLMGGVALLLIWAGIVESFFSQYHEPVLPYGLKIFYGAVQLVCLVLFLLLSGKKSQTV